MLPLPRQNLGAVHLPFGQLLPVLQQEVGPGVVVEICVFMAT